MISEEDVRWSREAAERVRREELRRLGITPTDPTAVWDFIEDGASLQVKHLEVWMQFVKHIKANRVTVFTDGDYATLTVIGPSGKTAKFSGSVLLLAPLSDVIADLLAVYPTRRSDYRKNEISRLVRVLLMPSARTRTLDAFLEDSALEAKRLARLSAREKGES